MEPDYQMFPTRRKTGCLHSCHQSNIITYRPLDVTVVQVMLAQEKIWVTFPAHCWHLLVIYPDIYLFFSEAFLSVWLTDWLIDCHLFKWCIVISLSGMASMLNVRQKTMFFFCLPCSPIMWSGKRCHVAVFSNKWLQKCEGCTIFLTWACAMCECRLVQSNVWICLWVHQLGPDLTETRI